MLELRMRSSNLSLAHLSQWLNEVWSLVRYWLCSPFPEPSFFPLCIFGSSNSSKSSLSAFLSDRLESDTFPRYRFAELFASFPALASHYLFQSFFSGLERQDWASFRAHWQPLLSACIRKHLAGKDVHAFCLRPGRGLFWWEGGLPIMPSPLSLSKVAAVGKSPPGKDPFWTPLKFFCCPSGRTGRTCCLVREMVVIGVSMCQVG